MRRQTTMRIFNKEKEVEQLNLSPRQYKLFKLYLDAKGRVFIWKGNRILDPDEIKEYKK